MSLDFSAHASQVKEIFFLLQYLVVKLGSFSFAANLRREPDWASAAEVLQEPDG